CHLQQAVHLRHRQAPVDHVRESPLARLARALGDVQEAGYGTVAALSRPTITTTVAEPESDATLASIGCACPTPRERAIPSASPWGRAGSSPTATWWAPGGRPPMGVACE